MIWFSVLSFCETGRKSISYLELLSIIFMLNSVSLSFTRMTLNGSECHAFNLNSYTDYLGFKLSATPWNTRAIVSYSQVIEDFEVDSSNESPMQSARLC